MILNFLQRFESFSVTVFLLLLPEVTKYNLGCVLDVIFNIIVPVYV